MPVALIVGLPPPLAGRVQRLFEGTFELRSEWSLARFDSIDGRTCGIVPRQIEALAKRAADSNGAHIIGVSKQDKAEKQKVSAQLKECFRFRWLDNQLLTHLSATPDLFADAFNTVLAEEELWRNTVRPSHASHPLLLPKRCFDARKDDLALWDESEQYGNIHAYSAVEKRIGDFSRRYKREVLDGSYLTDKASLAFKHDGPRHGAAPPPMDWKYSFKIPSFHFDVMHTERAAFNLRDCLDQLHSAAKGTHVNMDPHGFVRV